MIEQSVSLASNGVVKVPGYEQLVRFGYTKNRGVYRLHVDATGEWAGLTIRAFWHVPDGKDPASSLVVDGYVAVPASVTAQPGSGCVTFEGSDGTKPLAEQNAILATPIETPLTPDEIAAYKALTTYGPDTVVQAGDGAGIKLEYQRDVNIAIKRIEDAVASMTTT